MHEAQANAVFLLELLLVLLAQRHDRLHVDLVEGREDGVGLLRLEQALGHALTQARHRHALLGTAFQHAIEVNRGAGNRQCCRGIDGRQRRRGAGGRLGRGVQGIGLGDATVAAAAGHLGGIDAFFGQQFGSSRHGDAAGATTRRGRCSSLDRGSGGRRLGGSSGLRRGRTGGGFGVDDGDQLIGHDRGAVALLDVGDHASRRRGQFQHHLVGLDVDQVLVTGDGVADFLVPLQQRGLGHRLGQLRHLDFNLSHFGKTPGSFWEWGYGGTPRGQATAGPGGSRQMGGSVLVLAALGAAGTTESVVQQFLLLGKVLVVVADGRRGRGRTTCPSFRTSWK